MDSRGVPGKLESSNSIKQTRLLWAGETRSPLAQTRHVGLGPWRVASLAFGRGGAFASLCCTGIGSPASPLLLPPPSSLSPPSFSPSSPVL